MNFNDARRYESAVNSSRLNRNSPIFIATTMTQVSIAKSLINDGTGLINDAKF